MAIQYKNYLTPNVGTTPTTVYTASAAGTVIGLTLANTITKDTTVSVTLTSGATTAYVIKNVNLKQNNTLDVIQNSRLVVESGDIVKVSSSDASSVDIIVSTMEVV